MLMGFVGVIELANNEHGQSITTHPKTLAWTEQRASLEIDLVLFYRDNLR